MTQDDFNSMAWASFVQYAYGEPKLRAQFTAATGLNFPKAKTPIDAMVDAASGRVDDVAARFIEWVTIEHWGIESAPVAYQRSLADKGVRRS